MTELGPYSVAIVTFNSEGDIATCLKAVKSLDPHPREVIVADCGSQDRSVEIVAAFSGSDPSLIHLPLGENRGFAGGMNAALERTTAPWVATLNPDVEVTPDYFRRLLQLANTYADLPVAAVTGRLLRRVEPRTLDAAGMRLTPSWRHLDRGSGELDQEQLRQQCRVFGATGAATLWRREALEDVAIDGQAFDALFHSFREDAELCFRLRERGWEILFEPAAEAYHGRWVLPERRKSLPAAINRGSLKNRYLLRAYHQTLPNLLWSLLPCLTRDLAALVWVILRERSSLPAYGWLWAHRKEIRRRARLIRSRRKKPWWNLDQWFFRTSLPLAPRGDQEESG